MSKKRKRTLLFLICLFSVLLLTTVSLFLYEYHRIKPYDVEFSNVTSNSVIISWNTKRPTKASVIAFEKERNLPFFLVFFDRVNRFFDTRDIREAELLASEITNLSLYLNPKSSISMENFLFEKNVYYRGDYYTHHVAISGLKPETEYSFMVGDRDIYSKVSGRVKTSEVQDSVGNPLPGYGSLRDAKNEAFESYEDLEPITDAIVYLNYFDNDTGVRSNRFSSSVNEEGNWYVDLSGARDEFGNLFLETYKSTDDNIEIELRIDAGPLGIWEKLEEGDMVSPASVTVLNSIDYIEDYDRIKGVAYPLEEGKFVDLEEEIAVGEEVDSFLDRFVPMVHASAGDCISSGGQWSITGSCICPAGYRLTSGKCVRTEVTCKSNPRTCYCSCPSGYSESCPRGSKCTTTTLGCPQKDNCGNSCGNPSRKTCYKVKEVAKPTCTGCSCTATCPPAGFSEYSLTSCSSSTVDCADSKKVTCVRKDSCGSVCSLGGSSTYTRSCYKPNSAKTVIDKDLGVACMSSGGDWDPGRNVCVCPGNKAPNRSTGICPKVDNCVVNKSLCNCKCPTTHPLRSCPSGSNCVRTRISCSNKDNCGNNCPEQNKTLDCYRLTQENSDEGRSCNRPYEKQYIDGVCYMCEVVSNNLRLVRCKETKEEESKETKKLYYVAGSVCKSTDPKSIKGTIGLPTFYNSLEECKENLKPEEKKPLPHQDFRKIDEEILSRATESCWGNVLDYSLYVTNGEGYIMEKCDSSSRVMVSQEGTVTDIKCEKGGSCASLKLGDRCLAPNGVEFICAMECVGVGCLDQIFLLDISTLHNAPAEERIDAIYGEILGSIISSIVYEVELGEKCKYPSCICKSNSVKIAEGEYCQSSPSDCGYAYQQVLGKALPLTGGKVKDLSKMLLKLVSKYGATEVGVPSPFEILEEGVEHIFREGFGHLNNGGDGALIEIELPYDFVDPTKSDNDTEGKICSSLGGKCRSGVCVPPSDTLGVEDRVINENRNRLVSSVYADEDVDRYIISVDSETLSELQPGLYTFEYEGDLYSFVVNDSSGELTIFIDNNQNGVYDDGVDTKVSDIASELNVEVLSERYDYSLVEGFNFISFPFLVADEESRTAAGLLSRLNEVYKDSFYSISRFHAGDWKIVGENVEVYDNNDFLLLPGVGYMIKARRDVDISIVGRPIRFETDEDFAPVVFFEGWNLVGIYGTKAKEYTAKSLLSSVNSTEFMKGDNVTHWPKERQMYEGFQILDGQEYGFDFRINPLESYFVRITQGRGIWQPELKGD